MARRCKSVPSAVSLLQSRLKVEVEIKSAAIREGNDPEVSVVEVARRLAGHFPEYPDFAELFLAVERDIELALTMPMPGMVELLAHLSAKRRIVVISDTYLPASLIRELLDASGVGHFISAVYCSCEHGVSKGSGRLFRVVAEKESVALSEIMHIGDNYLNDYFRPRSMGIKARLIYDSDNLRRRSVLAALGRREHVKGWSEHAFMFRLEEGGLSRPASRSRLYHWGRQVVGPLLANFAHLLVEECIRIAPDAIFFIAREGHLLLKLYEFMADGIVGHTPSPARYLCLSRYTTFLASIRELGEREADRAVFDFAPSLSDVLLRFGVTRQEVAGLLAELDIPDDVPSRSVRENLLRLMREPRFSQIVLSRAAVLRDELAEYLRGEGFFSNRQIVLVDIGWFGSIQDLLGECFAGYDGMPLLTGLYLSLKRHRNDAGLNRKRGLVHDFRQSYPEAESLTFFPEALEFSCRANHGTTCGYQRRDDGRVVPLFRTDPQERTMDSGIREIQQGIMDCARDYLALMRLDPVDPRRLSSVLVKAYDRKLGMPDADLAATFDGFLSSEDFGTQRMKQIVQPFALRDLVNPASLRRLLIETPWREASLRKTGIPGAVPLFYAFRRFLAWHRLAGNRL
jgi:FMN phosphatase YigB (HAD superfamily)